MCGPYREDENRNPAKTLAALLDGVCFSGATVGFSEADIKNLIRNDWTKLCALAHAVHDEENSENRRLERAAELIAPLDSKGVLNAATGKAAFEVTQAFKTLAKEALARE